MVKIAVEEPFTSVLQALLQRGYMAEMLEDKTDAMDYDCVVVRDKEDLVDFHMNVPLVEAKGRTLFEIVEEVEERLVRSGKIMPPPPMESEEKSGSGGFIAGAATGVILGAVAGLLLAPKKGKEMQEMLKEKTAGSKTKLSDTVEQVKEKAADVSDKTKHKVDELKEKATEASDKTKGRVDELKTKYEEKKEEKELEMHEKEAEKELKAEEKAEEKAVKEHEKAAKEAEKEMKKAEKEAEKEKGGIEVVEFGDSAIEKNDSGDVTVQSVDKSKK